MFNSNWKKLQSNQPKLAKKVETSSTFIPKKPKTEAEVKPATATASLPLVSALNKPKHDVLYDPRRIKEMKDALIQKVDRSAPVKGKVVKKEKDNDPTTGWTLNRCKILVPYILEPVAMDCQMVRAGSVKRSTTVLARVSIVAQNGHVIYDKMVRPMAKIVDYFPETTGFVKSSFNGAIDHRVCAREVDSILRDRIVVGHSLASAFKALMFSHSAMLTRDLATYNKFQRAGGEAPQLRQLVHERLGKPVQEGPRDSVEDARLAMELYSAHKVEWEKGLNTQFGYKLAQHRRTVVKRAAKEEKHKELLALLAAKRAEKEERKRKRSERDGDDVDDDDDESDDDEGDSESEAAGESEDSGNDSEGSDASGSDSDSD